MATKTVAVVPTVATQSIVVPVSVSRKCSTTLDKKMGGQAVKSEVTFQLDSADALVEFALKRAIVWWQNRCADAGVVPESDTVTLSDMLKSSGHRGFKATPESLANRIDKMPADEYRQTLINLGIDKSTIDKLCKAHAK